MTHPTPSSQLDSEQFISFVVRISHAWHLPFYFFALTRGKYSEFATFSVLSLVFALGGELAHWGQDDSMQCVRMLWLNRYYGLVGDLDAGVAAGGPSASFLRASWHFSTTPFVQAYLLAGNFA